MITCLFPHQHTKRIPGIFVCFLAFSLVLLVAFAGSPDVFGQERLVASVVLESETAAPGDTVGVAIVMELEPLWHVYAGKGSPDEMAGYIATEIALTLPHGWNVGPTQWPAAHEILFGPPEMEERIRVYDGRAIAYIPVTIPAEATAEEVVIAAKVRYQACDDSICELPTESKAAATLKIVAAGAPPPPIPTDPEWATTFADYTPPWSAETIIDNNNLDTADGLPGIFRESAVGRAGMPENDPVAAAVEQFPPHKFKLGWKEARWLSIACLITVAMLFMIGKTVIITNRKGVITATLIGGVFASLGGWALALSAIRPHGEPFTFAAFDTARERGEIVIVDFTAEWCLNCKTVEARVLHHQEFKDFVARPDVTFLVADITTGQEEGQKLKDREPRFGGGIPILAIYHPGSDEIIIFQGIYTLGPVMEALQGNAPQIEAGQVFDFLGYRFSVGENAWPIILLLAGIAGFFLNLTPCVLPVIPIKILSLQAHAKNPARCFFLGVIFSSGIVAMFAVLGVLMGGVVVGMDKMQWGEFYQHWWVNLIVGIIILVMALGMFDVFTTRLPNWAYLFNPQSDTAKGSFFLGVLTAVLATPCTGPLLGAALVWVATQPAWLAMAMFIVMGVGMALPYVILTANPKWIERIPRSGPGSELVKQVMGLLLIAAAIFFLLAVPLSLGNASHTDTTQVGSTQPTPRVAG